MKYCVVSKDNEISLKLKDQLINEFGINDYDEIKPDYCFCIGGDGNYLSAVHKFIDIIDNVTFVNIKTGTLGFYSNIEASDIDKIKEIINNKHEYVYHDLLEFSYNDDKSDDIIKQYAVNEFAVYGVPEAIKLDVKVDGVKLENFYGTGLVVSTPTGSTGLSKSLNGAIIDERLKTLQITEIAGINNSLFKSIGNSIILDSSRIIEINIKNDEDFFASFDNRVVSLKNIKNIKINYSNLKVRNLKYVKKDFFERVQKSFL